MALDKTTLISDLEEALGANSQPSGSDSEAKLKQFASDLADAFEKYLKSGNIEFDAPVAELFASAVPDPNDGGAAILLSFQNEASSYPNTATIS